MKINLKDFRQAHGLFQSDMAEMLEMNQSNVSRAELRGYHELSYQQQQTLYDKYGKENVDSFAITDNEPISIVATGNTNEGDGTQNNGYFGTDREALSIIKAQSDAIIRLSAKQTEQTDKLLVLIDKLANKI